MSSVAATLAAVEIGSPLKRGSLHLFPLFSDLPAASSYLTGPDAAAKGVLRPEEMVSGAVVEALEIRNTSPSALLLLDGETLLGGEQNRCVNVSLLCPPRSVTIVSVSCVEAGRWGHRRETTRSSRVTPGILRAHNRTAVVRGGRPGGETIGDQQAVWSDIQRLTENLRVATPTSSMEDVYSATSQPVESLVGGTSPQAGQRGVAAFVSGELLAIDLFDTPQTMTDYWSGLVAGYALDALHAPVGSVHRRQVRSVLGGIARAGSTAAQSQGLGETSLLLGDSVSAIALSLSDVLVHLSAGPIGAG
jgi:hypothetical protein